MKPAYYNDNDAYCAAWLRNLIAAGHLPQGEVDERPIQAVAADDLGRFGQHHFFAGIGGWPLALRLARWPDDRPIWTGSCPCQPFSAAGKRRGTADERHLWPEFARLIGQCRPATVLGEQVASKAGREWLAGVLADMEGMGYATAGSDLCAASVGAPHIRQRLYWVADANDRCEGLESRSSSEMGQWPKDDASLGLGWGGATRRLADDAQHRCGQRGEVGGGRDSREHADARPGPVHDGAAIRLGDADDARPQGRDSGRYGADQRAAWATSVVIPCADGKTRRVEPSIFPLAHAGEWGAGSRVGILRGAGNAIVPALAAEFVAAVMECRP